MVRRLRSRRAGAVDNCFTCVSLLILGGLAAALYFTHGKLGDLPMWVKIVGPLVAVVLIAVAFSVEGGGFARRLPPGELGREDDERAP